MTHESRFPVRGLQALIALACVGSWETLGRAGWLSPIFFPTPWVILKTLIALLSSGELVTHLAATLLRVTCGFVLGGVVGLLIGLSMGWSRRLRELLDPFVAALHAVPKISLLPLIMIVMGIGEAPNLVIIGLASFFPIAINALSGVRQIDPLYCE
ncbi:MAG: ABC transporter permease subunit, partial [Acidobacteriota bacterium]